MKVYKFQDKQDGHHAFVIAETEEQATEKMRKETNLEVLLIDSIPIAQLKGAWFIYNDILCF